MPSAYGSGCAREGVDDAFRNSGCCGVPAMPYAQKATLGENVVRLENLTAHCRKNGVLEKTLEIASLELPVGSITALGRRMWRWKVHLRRGRMRPQPMRRNRDLRRGSPGKACAQAKMLHGHARMRATSSSRKACSTRWCSAWRDPTGSNAGSTSLRDLDLDLFAEDHPLSLSGGQRPARRHRPSACHQPGARRLRRADERSRPPSTCRQVAEGIRRVRERGITQVVITHDPEFALSCCTHVAVMDRGRITEAYPLEESGISRLASFFRSEYHAGEDDLSIRKTSSSRQKE